MKRNANQGAEKVSAWATHFTDGEQIRGLFSIAGARHSPVKVSTRRQAEVLRGHEGSGNTLGRLLTRILLELGGTASPTTDTRRSTTPAERARLGKMSTKRTRGAITSCWQFGDWDTAGGQLLVASQPKSRTDFVSYLVIGTSRLVVFHVQDAAKVSEFGRVAEANWTISSDQLTWTRDTRDKLNDGGLQLGFADGSWMTIVAAPVHGFPDYAEVFPSIVPRTQPIPPA